MEQYGREYRMKDNKVFRKVNDKLTKEDILMLGPLQLAYIGDAVYELFVRTYVLDGNKSVNELHKSSTKYVKADAQARFIHNLEDKLTEKEIAIVKKGRNAKSNTSPKNADIVDYKYATGFECLFGYLYLREDYDRLYELFMLIIKDKEGKHEG
ncbi:MAG TPA: ribonuclease III domain-containing protein [Tissierellaceae bacterium]